MPPELPRVAVVGTGAWGTTLALLVSRREPVTLLGHSAATVERIVSTRRNEPRLPGVELPEAVRVTAEASALEAAELVVFAVPSRHLRGTAVRAAPHVRADADLLSVVKGLEAGTLERMSEVVAQALHVPDRRVAALSGPNLALEIARGLPASAVVAAEDEALARRIQARLGRRRLIYAVLAERVVKLYQPRGLWRHWEEPQIHWFSGGHVLGIWNGTIGDFMARALETSGMRGRSSRR